MKGHAKIKVEIKNGFLFVYHNDGTLLHKRNATPQTWEKIWQVIENKKTMRNDREDIIENFFMKLDRLTFKAVKIMCIFAPLYILFQIIFNS